ncbi:MAG: type II toxin-antitoxin system VapC family toxin [Opitutales bacterium]|nr:type II toxin-antitoxin system VapC family toxin [Opitutales bacterium]
MIVVDNNILVDFWLRDGDFRLKAQELFQRDCEWVAPSLWKYEFGKVLQDHLREDQLSFEVRDRIWIGCLQMVHTVEDIEVLSIDDIARSMGLTFYDASYLWLARCRELQLYTRDDKILKAAPDVALLP